MADDDRSGDRGDAVDRPQDPLVARLRPDPSQPPEPTRTLEGVLGDSDRPGFRRVYVTPELDQYAEFRTDDVISVADIPPDQPPFLGEPATRVTLRRDAPVDFTRSHRARPLDEFDLDVRLAAAGRAAAPGQPVTFGEPGCLETYGFGCVDTFDFGCHQLATFIDCPSEACTLTCWPTCGGTCITCGGTCAPTCGRTCFTCGPTCGRTCACPTRQFVACVTRQCEVEP